MRMRKPLSILWRFIIVMIIAISLSLIITTTFDLTELWAVIVGLVCGIIPVQIASDWMFLEEK